jgi:endonuclease-3
MKPEVARARAILRVLKKTYPDARCELDHQGAFQLLVATVLSAQCTDKAVNKVTPALFNQYPDAKSFAYASVQSVEKHIKSIGLYHAKAKHLLGLAKALMADHAGQVPQTREALMRLPGVGRKTANVVLPNAFGLPGFAVDTHVLRVGRRLGFFESQDPLKVEVVLCELLPAAQWGLASHLFIWHGRRQCSARTPLCLSCPVQKQCHFREKTL